MDSFYVRQRLRSALAMTGTAVAEASALTGRTLPEPEAAFLSKVVRGEPRIDKAEVIQIEAIGEIAGRTLDVLRVLRANYPTILDAAIVIVRDAAIAEAEAPEVKIGEAATL